MDQQDTNMLWIWSPRTRILKNLRQPKKLLAKGRLILQNWMNFWKNSKHPLTLPPHFRKIILRILRQNCDKIATKVRMFIMAGLLCII